MEPAATDMDWATLSDPIFAHATARPAAIALVQRDTRLTYGTLAALIGRASVHLHGRGIRPGDVVAIGLGLGIDAVALTLATLRLGAVPIDVAALRPADLAAPLTRFGATHLLAPTAVAVPDGVTCHPVDTAFRAALEGLGGDRRTARDPAEPHLLHLATDRRGGPKAIAVTQHQMQARMRSALGLFPAIFAPGTPPMLLLSSGMGFAATILIATQFALGGPIGLLPADPEPERLARLLAGAGDAACLLSASQCRRLLALPPTDTPRFPKLRGLIYGAGTLTAEETAAVRARLYPGASAQHGSAAIGFLAAALPGPCAPQIWAEAADGAGRPAPPGRVGHLRFRGPGVAQSLLRAPPEEVAAEGMRDGWYYPGDIGTVDAQGRVTLTGRPGDLLRRRGVDLFVPDIEQTLRAQSGVADAAIVGITLPEAKDMLLVGFVVPTDIDAGQDPAAALARQCETALPPARRPDRLALVRQLPRLADGRVDRRRLAALAMRDVAA